MNNNKIILTALISGLLSFNASAEIIKPGKDLVPTTFGAHAPKAITDLGTRLSINSKKTKIRMTNHYSTTESLLYKINYRFWEPSEQALEKGDEMSALIPPNGTFEEVDLHKFATEVDVTVTDASGKAFPGMSKIRLCGYDNYIYERTENPDEATSIMELTFYKNDKNEMAAKIGLPQSSKNKEYRVNYQYNKCSTQSGAPGEQPEVSPDDNGWEQPGR